MSLMSVAVKIQEKIIDKNYCDTHGLLKDNPVYKPFRYPWCYDAWLTQQRIHWLPEEVPILFWIFNNDRLFSNLKISLARLL